MGRTKSQTPPPLVQADGTIVANDDQNAVLLNNHFANQSRLDSDDARNPMASDENKPIPAMELFEVSPREVLELLNSLDPNKSCGSDEVPPKILKLVALLICEPLAKLFNASLSSGVYPAIWKLANIHPIYKKGSPSDPTIYRPIRILPCTPKLLEKIVLKRIYQHATVNSLLNQNQNGYRPGHGKQVQLLHLTQNICSNLDLGNGFTAIYLDIAKYFDEIWHRGLLLKCEKRIRH